MTYLSKLLIRNGIAVIVPVISPYRETRRYARCQIERFVEMYVKCRLKNASAGTLRALCQSPQRRDK